MKPSLKYTFRYKYAKFEANPYKLDTQNACLKQPRLVKFDTEKKASNNPCACMQALMGASVIDGLSLCWAKLPRHSQLI